MSSSFDADVTWHESRDYCMQNGGDLATLFNETVTEVVMREVLLNITNSAKDIQKFLFSA